MRKVSTALHFIRSRPSLAADGHSEASWVPNTDVYLCDGGLVIKVELSGIRREDLELVIEGSRVRISGQRPDGCRPSQCKFLVMEINYGPFETVIELPPGYDPGKARAAYQNGFLRIDVPRRATGPG